MNINMALLTNIGNAFTQSDWFSMVKWPFWLLLSAVAIGGVLCARSGKKNVLNQSIGGSLNLLIIYLGTAIACIYSPSLRDFVSGLPFLYISAQGASLVDPLALYAWDLAPLLLRLWILTILIILADSLRYNAKSILSWIVSQVVTVSIALLMYAITTAGISMLLPALLNEYAIFPVFFLTSAVIVMLLAKFIFTVIISGGNSYFKSVWKFFTTNKGGSMLTASVLASMLSFAVLYFLQITGNTVLSYANANRAGLWIIMAMLLTAMYIFSMLYSERKKA